MAVKKIDVFPHILPEAVFQRVRELAPAFASSPGITSRPSLFDLDERLRIMDRYEDYVQVLTLSIPPIEQLAKGQQGIDLAKLANDRLAELVAKYPDRFVGFAAAVMLEDVDASIVELERAVGQLGALGAQTFTNINGAPLDEPRFEPFFSKIAELNKVLWVHPVRGADFPDYATEKASKYGLHMKLGWPYETSVCMSRLVFSGVMQRNPKLRVLTHHAGGLVPHFAGRLVLMHESASQRATMGLGDEWEPAQVLDAYRRFYGDTVFSGMHHPLQCALDFFGDDHIMFGTDMPYGDEAGEMFVRETIAAVDETATGQQQRQRLFEDNARQLLGLTAS